MNRNAVPNDPRPPMISSGLRIGTPALATRGLQLDDFTQLGRIIRVALGSDFEQTRDELIAEVRAIVDRYPLYACLSIGAARPVTA